MPHAEDVLDSDSQSSSWVTGVVLRQVPYRDADLILSVFSAERGTVSLLARGGRRSKRRFMGALSTFTLARFTLDKDRGSEISPINGAEVVQEWSVIAADVGAFAHANYALELISALIAAQTPEPELLTALLDLWNVLSVAGPQPAALRWFELKVLATCGSLPQLDTCVRCNDELAAKAFFLAARGGALCVSCTDHEQVAHAVSPCDRPVRVALAALRDFDLPTEAMALTIPRDVANHVRAITLAMVTTLAPHPLQSLQFLAKMNRAMRQA